MTFQQKFDMRVRRLLGVTDDSKPVHIYTNTDLGGCDTCGYGGADPIEISCAGKSKGYSSLPTLLSDLDKVTM